MAPTSFILVINLIIHERFLTYTCLLIYLGSGVDPISGKLHTYSFMFMLIHSGEINLSIHGLHAYLFVLDHV
jgi:hypothetical protein